ncbi:DUF4831 family protein [Alistipes sp. Z76]|nr:DUF4831 family protein [Alistipes sp. Z76]NCE67213.1 DUF4831 family protein [Muribaculaceae bacterium M3]
MKRVLSIAALALALHTGASAQNTIYKAVVGTYTDASGAVVVSDPSTIVAVDLIIEKEQTIVGPYARYAQKYLDVRGSLVEKTIYTVKDARLSVLDGDEAFRSGETTPYAIATVSYMGSETEFPKVLPDRLTATAQSAEDAAAAAAQAIFSIRKHRMELITGEAGENVFGGGLKDALEALDAKEQEYLELFLGKKVVTTSTERIIIPMVAEQQNYHVARVSISAGILPPTSTDGEAVTLILTPSGSAKLGSLPEADLRDKTAVRVRIADNTNCVVAVGDKPVASAVLPIFELGRTVSVAAPAAKK